MIQHLETPKKKKKEKAMFRSNCLFIKITDFKRFFFLFPRRKVTI